MDWGREYVDNGSKQGCYGQRRGREQRLEHRLSSIGSSIDACVRWSDGKAYFFKGSRYLRYIIDTDALEEGTVNIGDRCRDPRQLALSM